MTFLLLQKPVSNGHLAERAGSIHHCCLSLSVFSDGVYEYLEFSECSASKVFPTFQQATGLLGTPMPKYGKLPNLYHVPC